MKLPQWTESGACLSGGHCAACRSRGAGGVSFRAGLLRDGWPLPDGAPDFECPHGRPWGFIPGEADAAERALLDAATNPQGWGDHVAAAIHKIGADRAYKMVRRAAGLTSGCSACNKRREAINRLEGWVKGIFGP